MTVSVPTAGVDFAVTKDGTAIPAQEKPLAGDGLTRPDGGPLTGEDRPKSPRDEASTDTQERGGATAG